MIYCKLCGLEFESGYEPHFLWRENHVYEILEQISRNMNLPYPELLYCLRRGDYLDFRIKYKMDEEIFYQRIYKPLSNFIEMNILIQK